MGQSVADVSKKTVGKAIDNVRERKKKRLYIEDLREGQESEVICEPEIPGSESFSKSKHTSYFDEEVYTPDETMQKNDRTVCKYGIGRQKAELAAL